MKKAWRVVILVALLFGLFAVPASAAAPAQSYLLLSSGASLPNGIEASVAKAGGEVTNLIPEAGIAVASSSSANFKAKAAKITGIRAVVPNIKIKWIDPDMQVEVSEEIGYPPNSGSADYYFDLEWGMTAVKAVDAWNAGYTGAGARVAVLDSGIDRTNPDLAPNLNVDLSASFVPGEGPFYDLPGITFSHGTHVAGTIAAAWNNWGVIGVAPDAELVSVKVLSQVSGSGSWEGVIAGIIYATDIDADVINMSLGGIVYRGGFVDEDGVYVSAKEVNELINAMNRATSYAWKNGSLVVASAGNDAIDFNHTADLVDMPAQAVNVVTVAATAPVGWALDPANADLDVPTTYTNYGTSAIDLAAPGGDGAYPGNEICTVGIVTNPCWVFDYVFSSGPCYGGSCGFYWAGGTSMAAPHVSGVAALVVGKYGGEIGAAQLASILQQTADDVGKPGKDMWTGHGRVNAYEAVMAK